MRTPHTLPKPTNPPTYVTTAVISNVTLVLPGVEIKTNTVIFCLVVYNLLVDFITQLYQ